MIVLLGSNPLYISLDAPLVDAGLRGDTSRRPALEVDVDDEIKAVVV